MCDVHVESTTPPEDTNTFSKLLGYNNYSKVRGTQISFTKIDLSDKETAGHESHLDNLKTIDFLLLSFHPFE